VITIYLTSVIGCLSWILTYVHIQKTVSIHSTSHNVQIYTSIYLCWYQMMADSTMTTTRRTTTAATATPVTAQAVVHWVGVGSPGNWAHIHSYCMCSSMCTTLEVHYLWSC